MTTVARLFYREDDRALPILLLAVLAVNGYRKKCATLVKQLMTRGFGIVCESPKSPSTFATFTNVKGKMQITNR